MMQLRVLGSSGGWPAGGRPCSGYLLVAAGRRIWIDAGTGTLVELLRFTTLAELDAIWISHLHPDHAADLVAAHHLLTYGPGRDAALPVFGPPGWPRWLDAHRDPDASNAVFAATELTVDAVFQVGDVTLTAVAVRHGIATFGVRAVAGGRTLSYTADSAPCEAIVELARGADLFLCEAFASTGAASEFSGVMAPADAGRAASAGRASRLVLTHLHPDADPGCAVAGASVEFAGPVEVAVPGRTFEV